MPSKPAHIPYASKPVPAPDGVAKALAAVFPETPDLHRYFLLDGGTLANLPERLGNLNVTSTPVFDAKMGPELASLSPYLVQMETGNAHAEKLFTQWCQLSNDGADPFALLDMRPGLLLLSPLEINELRATLRRFVMLPDENGTRMFFRFQEPGMLAALLRVAPQEAQAKVLSCLSRIIWSERALEDDQWRVRCIDQSVPDDVTPRLPIIDGAVRKALAHAINRQRGRKIARAAGDTIENRIDIAKVITRVLDAKHSGPDWLLLHFYNLLQRAPADWQTYWWARVEARTESLAVLNRGMHDHHGVGEFKR